MFSADAPAVTDSPAESISSIHPLTDGAAGPGGVSGGAPDGPPGGQEVPGLVRQTLQSERTPEDDDPPVG